jgi:hypothetical protein
MMGVGYFISDTLRSLRAAEGGKSGVSEKWKLRLLIVAGMIILFIFIELTAPKDWIPSW